MKSMRNIAALFVLFSIAGVTTALAAKSVTVTNNTSYSMTEFYASASSAADFDTTTNLYAGQTLAPGQQATISINDGVRNCHYDLMAVLNGNTQYAYTYSIDACRGVGSWSITGE
jgi:uncharacterized protein YabE (DUF348 family)